jgi:predicted dienelactone hydrolase
LWRGLHLAAKLHCFRNICEMKIASQSLLVIAFAAALPVAAFAEDAATYNAKSLEAPELGRAGDYPVGTKSREIQLPVRVILSANGVGEGARNVGLRFWYPAATAKGTSAIYRHSSNMADKSAYEVIEHGAALDGVAAAKGKFPLVVISHGFAGWSEQLSRLAEHLASRGYVVAAIDHHDMAFDSVPGFMLSFGKVLTDRALDQKQIIRKLSDPAFVKAEPALASADSNKLGLVGYSMGGFGALGTSGAAYDPTGKPFAGLPGASKAQAVAGDVQIAALVDAVVLIAPWGGQPDNRAWTASGLVEMKKPVLFIAGDQDDIVNYKEGVRWLFDGTKAAERYMLVYRDARHNIAANMQDLGPNPSAEVVGYSREPVWRQDRLNQINQHFVTAFLDFTLKADTLKRRYLDVPTPVASDGKWPIAFGTLDRGAMAGDGQADYWRGFQRRWAIGLELYHKAAGE